MVSQYGIKYAVHIIATHFGNTVSKVCECLLRKGPLSMPNIMRFTELSRESVKNSLLVLIQHNCVQAFNLAPSDDAEAEPRETRFLVVFDNICHRMRFPKFLMIVNQELGKECKEVVEGLLENGRLTMKQMFERAGSNVDEGNCAIQDAVRDYLRNLVTARFVEQCPAPEPEIAPTEELPKRRGSKVWGGSWDFIQQKLSSGIRIHDEDEIAFTPPKSIEERVIEAAIPMDAKRFSLVTNDDINVDEDNNDDNPSLGTSVGEKRKYGDLEPDLKDPTDEKRVIWRANFEEFTRRLRHKACIENIRARMDDGVATVASAMLEASRSTEFQVKMECTAPLTLDTIFEEVMKTEAGRTMTLDRVRACLDQMGTTRGKDDTYNLNLRNIIELAQTDEVESIVLKRYGKESYRMFRLLSKSSSPLETSKISDNTFVEKKDASNFLSKLWKDDYLEMEKLSLGESKNMEFLLWRVKKDVVYEHVLDEMYHAALNLTIRVTDEWEREKEILELPKEKKMVEPTRSKVQRLTKIKVLMGSSLVKLDDAIMLFHDF